MKRISLLLLVAAAGLTTASARPAAPEAAATDACSLPAKKPVWIDFADGSVPYWELFATPGTVDADYRGEIGVILVNLCKEPFRITRGMRIAQLVVARHARAVWREVSELDRTARGAGGFGSTGVTGGSAKNA